MNKVERNLGIERLNEVNRSVFSWIVRPLILCMWPRRSNRIVRNIANFISTFRLVASLAVVALVVYPAYVNEEHSRLYIGLAAMFALLISDGLDGAIARGLMSTSRYGKVVDPLADKVFYLSGAAALFLGSRHVLHNELGISLLIVLIPALYFEIRLVMIALITKRECDKRDATEPAGANSWGKTKFAIQASAIFIGFGLPWLMLGFSMTTALIALSLPMAYFSLKGHQLNLEAIKLKPTIGQ